MSSQRGNVCRTRPQKHLNRHVFKNDLHDTNIRTKRVNSTQITNVCSKCKDILEWKIKYKKFKPLKTAKSCNKCLNKTVKKPYHTICSSCASGSRICPKCGSKLEENSESSTIDGNKITSTDSTNDVAYSSDDNYSDGSDDN